MTEAAPWSDHIIEPGPDSPLAVLSLAWLAQLRAAMEREYAAREWSRRWRAVAWRQKRAAEHHFVWGQQWQEYYRQKDALLTEVMAGYADVVQQVKAERDRERQAKEALQVALGAAVRAMESWRDGYHDLLAERDTARRWSKAWRAVAGYRRGQAAFALRLLATRDTELAEARADARRLALNVARAASHLPPLGVDAFAAWEVEQGGCEG